MDYPDSRSPWTLPEEEEAYFTEKIWRPVTKQEMQQRGWDQVDFVYITGDAYVDHPSFGSAIISRLHSSSGRKHLRITACARQ